MFQLPRGTRDFKPADMQKYRYIQQQISEIFQRFGYEEVRTPTFETLDLFTAKSGESIKEELYDFTDKGGRKLTLRPELTAPVIRFYIDQLQMEPKPLKLYYIGNCFRYDRPQKGRYREFWQAGCELFGPNTPEAYAELIALAYTQLHSLGLNNITVNIGNLTIIDALFTQLNLTSEQKQYLPPLIDKVLYEDITHALQDFDVSQEHITRFINLLETTDIDHLSTHMKNHQEAREQLNLTKQVIELLHQNFQITTCQLKMSIVRGLEYYKGIVFEIEAPSLGAEKQLCGGGVYELISLFGGNDVPTAGFAIGMDRTILALETEGITFPNPEPEIYIIPVDQTTIPQSITIATMLRTHGYITDLDLLRRGVGKALKYANTKHYQYIIIIGPKELEQQAVTLRNMMTGEQTIVPYNDLLSKLE
ncbi:MAG: histidine--tRNA ligase [Candidatus Thermoplasmatota archaeon]|nr:histidine--tRNA ligase [Candidatus Thermoplasmatota archaeon]MBU1941401.1 histidine--tRNA ligase [Candidatus Thermoplasmatota archaeon]